MGASVVEMVRDALSQRDDDANANFGFLNDRLSVLEGRAALKSLGQRLAESEAFKALRHSGNATAARMTLAGIELKAVAPLLTSDIEPVPQRFVGTPVAPAALWQAFVSVPVTDSGAAQTVMPELDGDADVQVEGEPKASASVKFGSSLVPLATIAVTASASKQVLDDVPTLARTVDLVLGQMLDQRIDAWLVAGLSAIATAYAGTPVVAAATLRAAGAATSVIGMNASDFSTWADQGSAADTLTILDRLGAVVVPTGAVASGTFLACASPSGAILGIKDRAYEIARSDGDNFRRNMIALRAEQRLALLPFDTRLLLLGTLPA